jgi:integrase
MVTMAKLTTKELEALTTDAIGTTIRDDDGMRGKVRSNQHSKNRISVTFIYRYRWQRATYDYPCGTWPAKSLASIRSERNKARALLDSGKDPIEKKKTEVEADIVAKKARLAAAERTMAESQTLNDLFKEWVVTTSRNDGGAEIRRSFMHDVLPKLGTKEIRLLAEKDFRSVLDAIVARGSNRMAVMLLSDLKQMFRWAGSHRPWKKLLEDDPVEHLNPKKITARDYDGAERTRTLSTGEIRELAEQLPAAGLLRRTEIAMWVMLSTCCRIGEIVKAKWEQVDLEAGVWIIPKENAKNKVAHTVYLSSFALPYFRELRELSVASAWCYPDATDTNHVCIKSTTKQIRDRQLTALGRKPMSNRSKRADALILSGGDWVPHDLRRTGATVLQSLGLAPAVIERVLNHVEPNKLRRTYQTYDYAAEKREAWQLLGNRLTLLVHAPDNVVLWEKTA